MATLAIKGHTTRGKEVIEILEMLGGKNNSRLEGKEKDYVYIINSPYGKNIECRYAVSSVAYKVFTLEKFLENFPYKVGDKVIINMRGTIARYSLIQDIRWNSIFNKIEYKILSSWCDTSLIHIYKEQEIMEDLKELLVGMVKDENGDWVLNTHKDYEIKEVDGKFKLLKKASKYPETYEECAKLLGCFGAAYIDGYKGELLEKFKELLICRDAYWKIAGEQMGLGKPWEPYWTIYKHKFCLGTDKDKVIKECVTTGNRILAFPTEEMRDAFYENLKSLIEECKELL